MKNSNNAHLQSERLGILAHRLINMNVVPKVKVIEATSNLYLIDDKLVGQFPMFYGIVTVLPKIWSEEWGQDKDESYYWKKNPNGNLIDSLMTFFFLEYSMIGHIFIPGAQNINLYGGKILTKFSSSREIAYNIKSLASSQKMAMDLLDKININISKS